MDLKLDEQRLLAEFRHLPAEARKELLDHATMLVEKYRESATGGETKPENQCSLGRQPEKRPETVKEPIFTE